MMSTNNFAANRDYQWELDESTIDFVTSYNSFPTFKSPASLSPSSYSSIDDSPSSNWPVEADDSGLDGTNMSCCTSYPSSTYSNSNTNLTVTDSSAGNMTDSTSFAGSTNFMLHSQQGQSQQQQASSSVMLVQPALQAVSQQQASRQRPVFARSNSLLADCSSGSNGMSGPSAGFRSQSNSFSNGQRPIFNHVTSRLASSANCLLQSQPPPTSLHQDETEATLFEFPTPNPIQVAQVSSRTGSSDRLTQQPELRLLSQPSRNHRARYRTEGSRGAIKDRLGRSFPVIKLYGYNLAAVKVRCFIGHDKKPGEAHLYYQVSRIIGKNITPCTISKVEGIKIIEFELSPENDMQAVVNCIGIVKERNFDVQRKSCNINKRKSSPTPSDQDSEPLVMDKMSSANNDTRSSSSASNQLMKRSTTCNLVFTAFLPGLNQTVQVISDTINCAQILGSPEVHKISATRDARCGGAEIFVIGKNFTRDSKIVWDFLPQHKSVTQLMISGSTHPSAVKSDSKSRIKETDPENEFINQNHLIFRVPPLKTLTHDFDGNEIFPNSYSFNPDVGQKAVVPVTLRIRCGEKYSDPILFTFTDPVLHQNVQLHDSMST